MTAYEILHEALCSDVGLAVQADSPDRLRLRLYAERQKQQKQGNRIFDDLSFFEHSDGELWIISRATLQKWRDSLESSQENSPGS